MVTLRARVNCFRCGTAVDKTETLVLRTITTEKRYECAVCYKKNRTSPWGMDDKIKIKQELYCQRCKFKFRSKSSLCPYCNKGDFLTNSNIKIEDLI